jgi:hypothetical protein
MAIANIIGIPISPTSSTIRANLSPSGDKSIPNFLSIPSIVFVTKTKIILVKTASWLCLKSITPLMKLFLSLNTINSKTVKIKMSTASDIKNSGKPTRSEKYCLDLRTP